MSVQGYTCVGDSRLKTSDILPEHQKIFLQSPLKSKSYKKAARFYQNVGLIPKPVSPVANESLQKTLMQKSVQSVNDASIPGTNGSILAGVRIADDTLSLTRNVMFALPALGPRDPIANHLGYYAGIFWTFFAARELGDGCIELERSKQIQDREGEERAKQRILSGSLVSAASLSYLGGKICDSFGSLDVATKMLGVSNLFFGAGAALAGGSSLVGMMRCNRFENRLHQYLKHPTLREEQRLQGAIEFLKGSLSISPEKADKVRAKIEKQFPDSTPEEKEQIYQDRMAHLTERQVKYLKRRTSNQSIRLICDHADAILQKLQDPKQVSEGMHQAYLLISKVLKDNQLKKTLFGLGLIAAAISLVAMVILQFGGVGALPFVLYGIAGTIYLCTSIYQIAGLIIKPLKKESLSGTVKNFTSLALV